MIDRSTSVRHALRSRQRGFVIDPYRATPALTPLLDALGGPATSGAYSLHRLRAAFTGYPTHVRKGGDATGIDIGFVGDNVDAVAILAYGAGGTVTGIFNDQGSSSIGPMDAVSQAAEPVIAASGSMVSVGTGQYGIQMNGSTTMLKHGSTGTGSPLSTNTRLTVLRFDAITGSNIDGNSVDQSLYFSASGQIATYNGASGVIKSSITLSTFACVIECFGNGTGPGYPGASFNGVEAVGYAPGSSGAINYRALGGSYNGTASPGAAVTICERIIFPVPTSVADRLDIYNKVKARWPALP